MAGTIVADTLTHSSAGSVSTQYPVKGSARAYVLYDMVGSAISANGTGNSLNISSMTDAGGGRGKPTFTNNMSDAQYVPVCSAHYSGVSANLTNIRFSSPCSLTTSTYEKVTGYANASLEDGFKQSVVFGDLA
tara:strand:+ start:1259 stop:1657 length:399 start_codon:yes stop_codon:yes gene_type:complete